MKTGRQSLINEFFKLSSPISKEVSNSIPENLSVRYVTFCKKCSITTAAADLQTTEKCQICSSALEYRCTLCDLQFFNLTSVKNHVIEGLEKTPTTMKCSKCCRSYFSSSCSLSKHERFCNVNFRFDKKILITLDRCDLQPVSNDNIKPLMSWTLHKEYDSKNLNDLKIENDFPYVHDDIEIGEEFKTPFLINQPTFSTQTSSTVYLTFCVKCRKTKYPTKTRNSCFKCKSAFQYKCKNCRIIFQTIASFREHMCEKNERKFNCQLCDYKVDQKVNLKIHMEKKHSVFEPKFKKCENCGKIFTKNYFRHSKICGRIFNCDHCGYKTSCKPNFIRHMKLKHLPWDTNLNKCNKCGKNFVEAVYYRKHLKVCGQPIDVINSLKNLSCADCDYKTFEKGNLRRHIKAKHSIPNYNLNNCKICSRHFKLPASLKGHLKTCGKDSETLSREKRFFCDHCDHKTRIKANLAHHMRAKHLLRDFNANNCHKCGQNFSAKSSLKNHLKFCGLSKDIRYLLARFSCDLCNYKADTKGQLRNHIQKKHLPQGPLIKCKNCKKKFSNRFFNKVHYEICGKDPERSLKFNRFVCDHCSYKGSTKARLRYHIQSRHLPPSFFCDYCDFKTSLKKSLLKHCQSKHSKDFIDVEN